MADQDLVEALITEAKAKWIATYVAEPAISDGDISKFKGEVLEYIQVFQGEHGENGRVNDNSAKIITNQARVLCYSETKATAEKYQLMMEQIAEQYTFSSGGGWWAATKYKEGKANNLWVYPLLVNSTLFRVREVIA